MGEYWKPVNLTKREYVNPHDMDCGAKLGEWHYPDTKVMRRVAELIESGQWSADDDIRIASDYNGEMQMYGSPRTLVKIAVEDENLYYHAGEHFRNVSTAEPRGEER